MAAVLKEGRVFFVSDNKTCQTVYDTLVGTFYFVAGSAQKITTEHPYSLSLDSEVTKEQHDNKTRYES